MANQITHSQTETGNSAELTDSELDNVVGGQQVYKHEFPGAVNQMTGLRPFEPPIATAVSAFGA